MLPNTHHPPPPPPQRPTHKPIPRHVLSHLRRPKRLPGPEPHLGGRSRVCETRPRRVCGRNSRRAFGSPLRRSRGEGQGEGLHRTLPQPLRRTRMLRTPVPETPVDEEGKALLGKNEIHPDVGRAIAPRAPFRAIRFPSPRPSGGIESDEKPLVVPRRQRIKVRGS